MKFNYVFCDIFNSLINEISFKNKWVEQNHCFSSISVLLILASSSLFPSDIPGHV